MSRDDLLVAAAAQHGFFTTELAAEHGINRRALAWRAQNGSAEQIAHGLYRLQHWPRLRSNPGITLHRSRHGARIDRALPDGLWVSTTRRALVDAARAWSDADQLVAAARDARARSMLTTDDLVELRQHPPFSGARL